MNILIIVRDDLVRSSISYIFQSSNSSLTIFEVDSLCEKVLESKSYEKIDLLIFDASQIEHANINKTIRMIKKFFKKIQIVGLFDVLDKIDAHRYFQLGINGCVEKAYCKDYLKMLVGEGECYYVPEHVMALHLVTGTQIPKINEVKTIPGAANGLRLTSRQEEVLDQIKYGKSNKEISGLLGLSEGTIRTHVTHIFNRLNVSNRTEAVHVATKLGFLEN
jgi:DNA-binding NarL/FixJ family response regulator